MGAFQNSREYCRLGTNEFGRHRKLDILISNGEEERGRKCMSLDHQCVARNDHQEEGRAPLCQTQARAGFSRAMFFCQDVTDHGTLTGSAGSLLFVCRDHSTPPLLGSKKGIGSASFRWSYADNLGDLTRRKEGRSRCSRKIPYHRRCRCFGYEVSPSNAYGSGTGKRISRIRSVAWNVSSRRRIGGRVVEFVNNHEYYLGLANVVFVNPGRKLQVRASVHVIAREPQSTVCRGENIWWNPVSSLQ